MIDQKSIRTLLMQKLADLENRISGLDEVLQAPLPADFEDQANDLENQGSMEALEERDRREVLAIRSAIKRIDNGTFGVCISCGIPISEKRIKLVPTALRCMDCETNEIKKS